MKTVKSILTVGVITALLVGCGSDVIAADDIKKMSALEVATLYCNAMKESDIDQLKVLVTDKDSLETLMSARFSSEKAIAKTKLKAEKYDCTITESKEYDRYTRFHFKNFKKVYVYKENGLNVLKI